ncbi:hypothetical protein JW848_02735 [Candidatus Bipolaricaulota bacterium]|nr:hypothetical protein [Candidatus Bipolaricaulota bacterium]
MKAAVVLTPPMSKRLIAQGLARHPVVSHALEQGRILVTLGTTNAYVAEELVGRPIARQAFAAGFIDGRWNINAKLGSALSAPEGSRNEALLGHGEILIDHGTAMSPPPDPIQLLETLGRVPGDVIIKGGNALDPFGNVGVLMAHPGGGTVGKYYALALARGIPLIIPIGLAKMILGSVLDLAPEMGQASLDRAMGLPCGLHPILGTIITEIEALDLLYGVDAFHVASDGVGRGVGSVSLLLKGEQESVERAFDAICSLQQQEESPIVLEGRA